MNDKYNHMTVGTRVHYTGDQANTEDEGTIVKVYSNQFYKLLYDVKLDDGRMCKSLFPCMFEPGAGRRFWPMDEWGAYRQEQRAKLQAFIDKYTKKEPVKETPSRFHLLDD